MQTVAVVVALVLLALLAAFQLALVAGAPWGRFAWGGQDEGVLPRSKRIGSVIAVLLYSVFAVLITERAGVTELLPGAVVRVGVWVLAGYLLIGIAMNLASRSKAERYTMTPVAAVLCAATVVVALG